MNWQQHITADPKILYGKPAIKGTRISVDLILEKLSYGETIDDLLKSYPHINREQNLACLAYASDSMRSESVYPLAS